MNEHVEKALRKKAQEIERELTTWKELAGLPPDCQLQVTLTLTKIPRVVTKIVSAGRAGQFVWKDITSSITAEEWKTILAVRLTERARHALELMRERKNKPTTGDVLEKATGRNFYDTTVNVSLSQVGLAFRIRRVGRNRADTEYKYQVFRVEMTPRRK